MGNDGTRLIARRYLDHKFVITSLIYRNSVHIEKKVAYAKYANVRNKFTNTPNESILKLKKKNNRSVTTVRKAITHCYITNR